MLVCVLPALLFKSKLKPFCESFLAGPAGLVLLPSNFPQRLFFLVGSIRVQSTLLFCHLYLSSACKLRVDRNHCFLVSCVLLVFRHSKQKSKCLPAITHWDCNPRGVVGTSLSLLPSPAYGCRHFLGRGYSSRRHIGLLRNLIAFISRAPMRRC